MRREYNFSRMKGEKNPYAKDLKTQITIRIDTETVSYFKELAESTGMSYQSLINLYLRECVKTGKKPTIKWFQASAKASP